MSPKSVTLRQMRAFVAVVDAGSFAAGARRLHLTPSALSMLVRELEGLVQVRLIERTTRHMRLTEAGEAFHPLARRLLQDVEQAVGVTQDLRLLRRGTVRIACTPLYASAVLPALVARFRAQFPAITVYLLDSLNQLALARALSGEADLAIAPQRPAPPELLQEHLFSDRLELICREDHPLAARARLTWAQVLRHPFVTLTPDFTQQLQADLYRHAPGLVLQPVHEVALLTTALGMVQWGHGITAQPASALELARAHGLVTRPIAAPRVHREISLYTLRARVLSPAAQRFTAFLREECAALSR